MRDGRRLSVMRIPQAELRARHAELYPDRHYYGSIPVEEAKTAQWMHVLSVVARNWKWSGLFAVTTMLAVIIFTALTKPTYEPSARLEISPPKSELFDADNAGGGVSDEEYINTQARNLESDQLVLAVIRHLRLDRNAELAGRFAAAPQKDTGASAEISDDITPVLTPGENAALTNFRRALKVERDKSSRIITVSFASQDPQLA
ncbi:MAG TPA: Wzz/FepE/Etk N-terminal domain-containing protein, partial [Terriglobales bacterium]